MENQWRHISLHQMMKSSVLSHRGLTYKKSKVFDTLAQRAGETAPQCLCSLSVYDVCDTVFLHAVLQHSSLCKYSLTEISVQFCAVIYCLQSCKSHFKHAILLKAHFIVQNRKSSCQFQPGILYITTYDKSIILNVHNYITR